MCSDYGQSGFHRDDEAAYIDQLPVHEILARYPTPVIVYSAARLRANARALRTAMTPAIRSLYSYKACYLPGVLSILHDLGVDAEVCSGSEYLLARRMGLPANRIAWNAVSLSDQEIILALEGGVSWLGLNTLTDIGRVAAIAAMRGTRVEVMIRIQPPGVDSAYLGADSRLGFRVDNGSAIRAGHMVLRYSALHLRGLHSHTQVRQADPRLHAEAARASFAFAARLAAETGHRIRTVSIGGGLAGREELRRHGADVDDFAAALLAARSSSGPAASWPIELAIEPGRFLVSDAAVGIASVLARTGHPDQPWLILDLGTQVLVPFEGREFHVFPAGPSRGPEILTRVGDRMSSYSGVINQGAQLPVDLGQGPLVIADVGAYTTSVAQRFMYGMPHVLMVDGRQLTSLWQADKDEEWVDRMMEGGIA